MLSSKLNVFVLAAALQGCLATKTPKYCSQSITATYDDLKAGTVVGQPIPSPYNGLDYAGWVAVTNADIGSLQGSVLKVQSPPTSIFFGEEFGMTSKTNTFTAAPGVDHFTLTSLYFACVAAPDGSVGLGGAAGGVNVPVGCTVQATGTTTTGQTVVTNLVVGPVTKQQLFKFPASFSNLKSVNFVLVTTSVLSGVTDVDVDNVSYTLYRAC